MKRPRILILMLACCAAAAMAQASYTDVQAKAQRFFDNREWASASAMYNFMLRERPSEADTYGHAIIANQMLGDSLRTMQLLSDAMAHGVALDSLLASVRKNAFGIGHAPLYERFMLEAAQSHQWMTRPLDAYLLRYYAFRRNGPQMVAYADRMLKGAPDNAQFLAVKAQGYLIDGQTALAVDTWHRMAQLDPDNYDALLWLANYYDMASDPAKALTYYQRAQSLRGTPYVAAAIDRITANHRRR